MGHMGKVVFVDVPAGDYGVHVNVRVCVEHMYRHVSTFVFMCGHILVLLVLICTISDQPHTHSNICSHLQMPI